MPTQLLENGVNESQVTKCGSLNIIANPEGQVGEEYRYKLYALGRKSDVGSII